MAANKAASGNDSKGSANPKRSAAKAGSIGALILILVVLAALKYWGGSPDKDAPPSAGDRGGSNSKESKPTGDKGETKQSGKSSSAVKASDSKPSSSEVSSTEPSDLEAGDSRAHTSENVVASADSSRPPRGQNAGVAASPAAANAPPAAKAQPPAKTEPPPKPPAAEKEGQSPAAERKPIVKGVTIRDLNGKVVFRGDVDLGKTIERVKEGKRLDRFQHDGVTFENRERRLPQQPRGYYREWVHPTEGLSGPGPQRLVTGRDGDIWYTHDHYKSFRRVQ